MSQMEEDYILIENIAKRCGRLRNRVEKDVVGVCKLLEKLDEICTPRDLPESLEASLRKHFRDIYWSLKLHLEFHLGSRIDSEPCDEEPNADLELKKVGCLPMVHLTDKEMNEKPDQKHAIDPGSKFLEIFSAIYIARNSGEQDSNHADGVMAIAKDLFKSLSSNNIFKPKVLAKVSHNDKWSVGSSVAVSEFLRPLCLYRRIANFKQSLKKAIVSDQHLVTEDNQNWSSLAFATNDDEWKPKPPCQNCTKMFKTLVGFINPKLGQGRSGTFLGACAEYCPVDQLLEDKALSAKDNQWINDKLQSYREQCTVLFSNFEDIEAQCNEVCVKVEQRRLRNMKFTDLCSEIRDKVHIFGVKPECNMYFGGRT